MPVPAAPVVSVILSSLLAVILPGAAASATATDAPAVVAIDVVQPWARTCDGLPECPNTSYPAPYPATSAMVAALF